MSKTLCEAQGLGKAYRIDPGPEIDNNGVARQGGAYCGTWNGIDPVGNNELQCCVSSCTAFGGTCADVRTDYKWCNSWKQGLCPGPWYIQCYTGTCT